MFDYKVWQGEFVRQTKRRSVLLDLIEAQQKRPPLPWYRRQWNLLRYRVSEFRERLGEIIAGRRFENY